MQPDRDLIDRNLAAGPGQKRALTHPVIITQELTEWPVDLG
jgi:hypothetical protein